MFLISGFTNSRTREKLFCWERLSVLIFSSLQTKMFLVGFSEDIKAGDAWRSNDWTDCDEKGSRLLADSWDNVRETVYSCSFTCLLVNIQLLFKCTCRDLQFIMFSGWVSWHSVLQEMHKGISLLYISFIREHNAVISCSNIMCLLKPFSLT